MHLIHVYGKKYERGSNWSEPEVLELLQIWSDVPVQTELVTCLRNQHVFNRIASTLRQKGINRTGDQCREKIKKLKLEYKQKTLRSARYYELMERAQSNRSAATSGSTLPLWGGTVTNQVTGMQGSEAPGQPPRAGEILEIKTEVMSSDDEAVGPPEMLYEFGPVDEDDEAGAAEHKHAGPNTEENTEMDGEQGNTHVICSPSDCSDQNMTGSSGAGVSPATAPIVMRDGGSHGDQVGGSGSFHQRKRRRVGRGGDGVLSNALAGYLSWQQTAEERFLALEEARMQQEAQAEERREQQEERRAKQERDHEFRLMSMLTKVLSSSRGTEDQSASTSRETLPVPSTSQTYLLPNSAKAVPSMLWGDQTAQYSPYLSRRGNSMRLHQGILQEGYNQYHANVHDENSNPHGIINLGTSENKLCFDLLQKRLMRPDMLQIEPAILQYPDWKGHSFLREEVAKFLSDYCRSPKPIKPKNVVVMNGCGSLFSALAATLCDPEGCQMPKEPTLCGASDFAMSGMRVGMVYSENRDLVQALDQLGCFHGVPGPTQYQMAQLLRDRGSDVRPFQLTVEKLENSLKEAKKEGLNIKALILLNPHNPLGEVYSSEEMINFLEFAKMHKLHVIVDEIYMLSVFNETDTFRSVLSLDGYWLNSEFLPENRQRLREAHSFMTEELKKLDIPFLHRSAGFFIWADLSKYLSEKTFAEELSLWRCFLKHKVLLSCGQAFSCVSPGWFRIIFTDQLHKLKLGVQRIKNALEELQGSSVLETQRTTSDEQDDSLGTAKREDTKTIDECKEQTLKTSSVQTKLDTVHIKTEPVSLADENFTVINGQSDIRSESLDSLIGTLRQQIHTSDWLEKHKPELGAGQDPTQLDVFTDLLDKARK
ncbi:1-aminocyclopropane-1-carboxylate synthase-like protein 1 [Sinocyclocheilus rhinocerous]|uniref:1-aminocyclopropane-1-carboxylate synthase-like protein 1 n=1 Tax=Sinocyclocheilus rhinocerous TaxID=307959 RepID=UPI0007B7E734|nr:PREDICTED: 1-aminocyclopropane-1-carboxylate synthase-like protein 1 [Sinocyclocheilus rhinocerous]